MTKNDLCLSMFKYKLGNLTYNEVYLQFKDLEDALLQVNNGGPAHRLVFSQFQKYGAFLEAYRYAEPNNPDYRFHLKEFPVLYTLDDNGIIKSTVFVSEHFAKNSFEYMLRVRDEILLKHPGIDPRQLNILENAP